MARKSLGKFSQEIPTGLFPDIEADKSPLWADGRNVLFEDGGTRPTLGRIVIAIKTQAHPGTGLIEMIQGAKKTLFWGTPKVGTDNGKLFRWQEGDTSIEDVSRVGDYTGTGIWSLVPWGEWVLATNGVDPPQVYGHPDDVNDFIDLYNATGVTGLLAGDTWELVTATQAFIFALNMDFNNQAFKWSTEDNVQVWNPLPSNQAGDGVARNLYSEIIAVSALANGLGVYGRDQLHFIEHIGGQLVHGTRPLLKGIGAYGKHSVVEVGGVNYGFGPRGFWKTDGAQSQYIDKDSVHDFVIDQLDEPNAHKVTSWVDSNAFTVFWSLPVFLGSGENQITVGFNYVTEAWTVVESGSTAATSGSVFETIHHIGFAGALMEETSEVGTFPGIPISLVASNQVIFGYGRLGYGELGYGGKYTSSG